MNPESVLKGVREKYVNLKSYADEGIADTVTANGKKSLDFKTCFASPGKVRFGWRVWHPHMGKSERPNESAIWTNGSESHKWFMGKVEPLGEFSAGIAGVTGVSSGSVHMILKLLLPDCIEGRSPWYEMQDIRMAEEVVNGLICFHLIGTDTNADDTEAWISKDDLVVRRLRKRTENTEEESESMVADARQSREGLGLPKLDLPKPSIGASKYYQEYSYHDIKINEPIADDVFEFDPSARET